MPNGFLKQYNPEQQYLIERMKQTQSGRRRPGFLNFTPSILERAELPLLAEQIEVPFEAEMARKRTESFKENELDKLIDKMRQKPKALVATWGIPFEEFADSGFTQEDVESRLEPYEFLWQEPETGRVAVRGSDPYAQLGPYEKFEKKIIESVNKPLFEVGGIGISASDLAGIGLIAYGGYQLLAKGIPAAYQKVMQGGFQESLKEWEKKAGVTLDKATANLFTREFVNYTSKRSPAWLTKESLGSLFRSELSGGARTIVATPQAQSSAKSTADAVLARLTPQIEKLTATKTGVPSMTMTQAEIQRAIQGVIPETAKAVESGRAGLPEEIPPAEPMFGETEAGIQPSMIPEVPAKEVRPVGKGVPTQISMDEQAKLAEARAAAKPAEVPPEEYPEEVEIYYAAQEASALRETLAEDAVAQYRVTMGKRRVPLTSFISIRKQNFPEYFTVKQARALNPKSTFDRYLQKGTKIYNHVPKDAALETVVQSLGMESADELAERVLAIRDAKIRIDDLEQKVKVYESEKAAIPKAELKTAPEAVQRVSEGVKPPVSIKPPVAEKISPEQEIERLGKRLDEVKAMLEKPARDLPKGTLKIELRQEIKKITERLEKLDKPKRQKIMAVLMSKGIPKSQYRKMFKDKGGTTSLSKIHSPQLDKILESAQKMRPVKIGQKAVVKLGTEKAIQSLKETLISEGKMSEETYKSIMKTNHLKTDKFESPDKFITESEAKNLLRDMNYYAEVGLMEKDIKIEEALEKNPEIKYAVGKVKGRITGDIYVEGKKIKPSPLQDMRYFMMKLQGGTGGRFYDVWQMANQKHLYNHVRLTVYMNRLKESTPYYKKIAGDDKAVERVSQYIEAKNKMSDIKSPKYITEEEVKLANEIEKVLFEFQPTVRFHRFKTAYSKHGDKIELIMDEIPDAPKEDIREAINIYESKGAKALMEYLNTKTWGVIESGYEPHRVVNPKLVTYKLKATVVGKGHLRTREGLEFDPESDKTLINRTFSYVRQMLNLELEPYLYEMDRIFAENIDKLREPGITKKHLQTAMDELKGYIQDDSPIMRVIAKIASWGYTAVFLAPHLSYRNLFQNMAFHPDRFSLLNPKNRWIGEGDKIYFKSYVSQQQNIARDLLLQSELGHSRAARFARKITYYGYSDEINRYISFFISINKAHRSLSNFAKDGNLEKLINSSGANDLANIQRKEFLEILAQDKVEIEGLGEVSGRQAAEWYLAREITNNTHFLYERAQRAPIEMGLTGRTVGSLLVFGRSVAQRMIIQANTLRAGSKATADQKIRAIKIIFGMIIFGLLAGEIYKDTTGKGTPVWKGEDPAEMASNLLQRNPYNPMNILQWTPGGLAIGVTQDMANVCRLLFNAAQGDEYSMSELTTELPALGDSVIPFYGVTMNILETATGTKYIDRKAMREMRDKFDEDYEPNDEYYLQKRGIIGQIQHALFGGEEPELSEIEKASEEIDNLLIPKLGKVDAEARQSAIDRAETPNDITKAVEKDWTYKMADLGSDLNRLTKNLDNEQIGEYLPEIVAEYVKAQPLIDAYFDLMADERWDYREQNPETDAVLVIWRGYEKMCTPDCEAIVRAFVAKYNIPENAIPALVKKPSSPRPITPQRIVPEIRTGGMFMPSQETGGMFENKETEGMFTPRR